MYRSLATAVIILCLFSVAISSGIWDEPHVQRIAQCNSFDTWPNQNGSIKTPIDLMQLIQSIVNPNVSELYYSTNLIIYGTNGLEIEYAYYDSCLYAQKHLLVDYADRAFLLSDTMSISNDYGDIFYKEDNRIFMTINNFYFKITSSLDTTTLNSFLSAIETATLNSTVINDLSESFSKPYLKSLEFSDSIFVDWRNRIGFGIKCVMNDTYDLKNFKIQISTENDTIYWIRSNTGSDTLKIGYIEGVGYLDKNFSDDNTMTIDIYARNAIGEVADTTITIQNEE